MDFCRTIFHVVQPGDTFYRLAQQYHTTVPGIIMRNPGINPYNLQVGTRLRICVGQEQGHFRPAEMDLHNDMRKAWSQHNFWDAMFVVSLFNALENTDAVQGRLMQTPEDIAAVFSKFYSMPIVNQLKQLLMEHVRLGGELTAAMRDNNMEQETLLENQLNQNADKIARSIHIVLSPYVPNKLWSNANRASFILKISYTPCSFTSALLPHKQSLSYLDILHFLP